MTQKERQERSRAEILQAAMEEFGQAGYEKTSMERLCTNHGISKGMMYHYYSHKDELFLLCVQKTFDVLKQYLEQNAEELSTREPLGAMRDYFLLRERFFDLYPQYKLIFETAMLYPPEHLSEQIQILHQAITDMNQRFLEEVISRMSLRPGLAPVSVTKYLQSIEPVLRSIVNRYHDIKPQNLHTVLETAQEILDMLFFGVLVRPEESDSL